MSLVAEEAILAAAAAYVDQIAARSGGVVTRSDLESFSFAGRTLRLIAPQQGIWKPKGFRVPISIMTTYSSDPSRRPYEDDIGVDGFPRYKWRRTGEGHADNVALRRAMETASPLIWFVGVAQGIYEPIKPVWIAGEEAAQQQFVLALEELAREQWTPDLATRSPRDLVRRYAERVVRQRLHQPVFRDRVLIAYGSRCTLCRLGHRELLDAAHIKEDSEGGEPILPNGLAMCAIHHRAFDAQVLGIRPDYRVEIRSDVLGERDGPTLMHALQGMHGGVISLPRRTREQPSPDLLEERYERFRAAG